MGEVSVSERGEEMSDVFMELERQTALGLKEEVKTWKLVNRPEEILLRILLTLLEIRELLEREDARKRLG